MNIRSRQDAIVRNLRRNGTSTVAELAEDVGASRRTVLRDISALRDEGFIIHSDPGRGGGVQLDPQSLQAKDRLSVGEVFALLISVASMRAAVTSRIVEPQAMLILPPLWYLVAWDPVRKDFRYFRIDRISVPEFIPDTPFRRRYVPFEDHVRPIRELGVVCETERDLR